MLTDEHVQCYNSKLSNCWYFIKTSAPVVRDKPCHMPDRTDTQTDGQTPDRCIMLTAIDAASIMSNAMLLGPVDMKRGMNLLFAVNVICWPMFTATFMILFMILSAEMTSCHAFG